MSALSSWPGAPWSPLRPPEPDYHEEVEKRGYVRGYHIDSFAEPIQTMPERRCPACGKQMSKYNKSRFCYACDDQIGELPTHDLPQTILTILKQADGEYVSVYAALTAAGVSTLRVSKALKHAATMAEAEGLRLEKGPHRSGHRVVKP